MREKYERGDELDERGERGARGRGERELGLGQGAVVGHFKITFNVGSFKNQR